ncbi:hypothetical protein A8C32_09365 [Flavivirga aquatica]|uniref:Uncharacterized protein n=1 Tax=Flavivirga aquatica TaxID=1849968 RepID=A0A1E5SJQ2_9FLAO|nr:hypothetical protein [Flavivirga aquatica]OEJ99349.1 hypothetical protein A8C32_09315 [Flavivirga aquatica]OEJ99359.1 hypothetical protein A8C32_09365 [Flavivirga aquatica]
MEQLKGVSIHKLLKSNPKTSIEVQNRASEVRRKEVFYIIYIITTVFKQQKIIRVKNCAERTYNANYVTYRGKGRHAKTRAVLVQNIWVGVPWDL